MCSPLERTGTSEELRTETLQHELDLTRAKLELLKLQQEPSQNSIPTMATAITTKVPGDNPPVQLSLKTRQQGPSSVGA